MSQINDLLQDSQAQFRAQRNETKGLVSKWDKTGLLEGITHEYDKHNTAILLENQAKQLISEANSTSATSAEEWNGVALPLVRRIFGEISAKEFVSVQPMNLPSGLVFWLDFKYGGHTGDAIGKGRHAEQDSIFGQTDKKGGANLTNALYSDSDDAVLGAGAGYSLAKKEAAVTVAENTASVINIAALDSAPSEIDYDLAGAFYIVSGSNHHTCSAVNGTTLSFGATTTGGAVTLVYYRNSTDALTRGDFEDRDIAELGNSGNTGTDLEIPEIEVKLEQEALVAKTRKLKVKWSPEFAQDLNAYHSIDAEAELTSMLSEYISMEIDLEILAMLHNAASASGFVMDFSASNIGGGMTQQDAFAEMGIAMQAMSNAIHQSTMRGGANFAVMSPQVATWVESIPGYTANTDGTAANFAMGVEAIGSMSNRWTVYKNPYWTGNEVLMGYRGSQFLETGAVFAPYIPLIMTPLVYDPTNFTPRKGVMTRYAKKVVRNDYYGVISVLSSLRWNSLGTLPTAQS
jgi:hypothetical protein